MKVAPPPANEKSRLLDLQSYDLLDTNPEKVYDDFVLLASEVCDTPIALISLIDSNRQWFMAKSGIDICETGRDVSFCSHAILQDDLFMVKDATLDDRFKDNPFTAEGPGVRFYAGMPLVNSRGHALGTLCVIDTKPRELSPSQKRVLSILSNQVVTQFELRRALIEKHKVADELNSLTMEILAKNDEVRYLEKFKALDQMAGKMSHELKNPLAGILLVIGSVKNQVTEPALKIKLSKAEILVKRMSSIITGLEVFSGMRDFEKECISTSKTIDELSSLLEQRLQDRDISLKIEATHVSVMASASQILQVLHSLLENSIDALESLDEKWIHIKITPDAEKNCAQIRVTDSGRGIPDDIASKMMLPFFTSKDVGKGVGLGLSLAHAILRDHKGDFRYEVYQGYTSFVLELPLCSL